MGATGFPPRPPPGRERRQHRRRAPGPVAHGSGLAGVARHGLVPDDRWARRAEYTPSGTAKVGLAAQPVCKVALRSERGVIRRRGFARCCPVLQCNPADPLVRKADLDARRPRRPHHPSCPHPGDERRQLAERAAAALVPAPQDHLARMRFTHTAHHPNFSSAGGFSAVCCGSVRRLRPKFDVCGQAISSTQSDKPPAAGDAHWPTHSAVTDRHNSLAAWRTAGCCGGVAGSSTTSVSPASFTASSFAQPNLRRGCAGWT